MAKSNGQFAANVVNVDNPSLAFGAGGVADDDFGADGNEAAFEKWKGLLNSHRPKIRHFGRSVCAILSFSSENKLNGEPAPGGLCSPLGTGFLVGADLILTNRHVAERLFYNLRKYPRQDDRFGWINFHHSGQPGQSGGDDRRIEKAVYIHKSGADIALLRLRTAVPAGRSPLKLSLAPIEGMVDRPSVVIGYPGSPYIDEKSRREEDGRLIFGNDLSESVKRVSPGHCQAGSAHAEFGRSHDCTTLPGSSGSPVIDLVNEAVIGIHYHGKQNRQDLNWYFAFADIPDVLQAIKGALGSPLDTVSDELAPIAGKTGFAAGRSRRSGENFPVTADLSDFRDVPYEPRFVASPAQVPAPFLFDHEVPDQDQEPSCTAHAVEAAIFIQRLRQYLADGPAKNSSAKRIRIPRLSTRMIYEMAVIHDEFPGRDTPGSSIRGAIKGLFHNGAATSKNGDWKDTKFELTFKRARDARRISIAAYRRLQPRVQDYQAAIHETGAVIASAYVHEGWIAPQKNKVKGKIQLHPRENYGAHAFVIVGYDEEGFLVLNSAGPEWGRFRQTDRELPGVARWLYSDWAQNILDGWVVTLAPQTPGAFGLSGRHRPPDLAGAQINRDAMLPRRHDLLGHCIRLEGGKLQDFGRYGASIKDLGETAHYLSRKQDKYDDVLFIAPAETMDETDALRLIGATRTTFKRNRIYPVYLLAETEFASAFSDFSASATAKARTVVPPSAVYFEDQLYQSSRRFGERLWESYRSAIAAGSEENGALDQVLDAMLHEFIQAGSGKKPRLRFHFLGHSAGARVVAAALDCWDRRAQRLPITSVHLFAPLMTMRDHDRDFIARLKSVAGSKKKARIERLYETIPAASPPIVKGTGNKRGLDWTGLASRLECLKGFAVNTLRISMLQRISSERSVKSSALHASSLLAQAHLLNELIAAMRSNARVAYPFESENFLALHAQSDDVE
jgi:hypothetical protein